MPEGYAWTEWKALVCRVLSDYPGNSIYKHISKRYIHGELRCSRLDKIYRYRLGNFLRGYSTLTGSTRYINFFEENLKFVTATTVYTVVVLTAMQVGLATNVLQQNESFNLASYGFTIFAILSPIIGVGFVVAIAIFMFIANWSSTTKACRRRYENFGVEDAPASQRGKHEDNSMIP